MNIEQSSATAVDSESASGAKASVTADASAASVGPLVQRGGGGPTRCFPVRKIGSSPTKSASSLGCAELQFLPRET